MEEKTLTIDLFLIVFPVSRRNLELIFLETQELKEGLEPNVRKLKEFLAQLSRQQLNVKLLLKELTILANFLEPNSKSFASTSSRNA